MEKKKKKSRENADPFEFYFDPEEARRKFPPSVVEYSGPYPKKFIRPPVGRMVRQGPFAPRIIPSRLPALIVRGRPQGWMPKRGLLKQGGLSKPPAAAKKMDFNASRGTLTNSPDETPEVKRSNSSGGTEMEEGNNRNRSSYGKEKQKKSCKETNHDYQKKLTFSNTEIKLSFEAPQKDIGKLSEESNNSAETQRKKKELHTSISHLNVSLGNLPPMIENRDLEGKKIHEQIVLESKEEKSPARCSSSGSEIKFCSTCRESLIPLSGTTSENKLHTKDLPDSNHEIISIIRSTSLSNPNSATDLESASRMNDKDEKEKTKLKISSEESSESSRNKKKLHSSTVGLNLSLFDTKPNKMNKNYQSASDCTSTADSKNSISSSSGTQVRDCSTCHGSLTRQENQNAPFAELSGSESGTPSNFSTESSRLKKKLHSSIVGLNISLRNSHRTSQSEQMLKRFQFFEEVKSSDSTSRFFVGADYFTR